MGIAIQRNMCEEAKWGRGGGGEWVAVADPDPGSGAFFTPISGIRDG
jgi:hypothetical protein